MITEILVDCQQITIAELYGERHDKCVNHDIVCRMRPCTSAQGVYCCQECKFNKTCLSKCKIKDNL